MEVSRWERGKRPFVLDEAAVSRLWRILEAHVGAVEASAFCRDRLTRRFETQESLLKYENVPSRRIQSITFAAADDVPSRRASVSFDADDGEHRIALSGPESSLIPLSGELKAVCSGVRPWYWFLARPPSGTPFLLATVFMLGILGTAATVVSWFHGAPPRPSHPDVLGAPPVLETFWVALAAVLFGLAIEWLRSVSFPRGVIALGRASHRHEQLEKLRWGVLAAFVVLLAAGLMTAAW